MNNNNNNNNNLPMKYEIRMEYLTYSEVVFSFRILCTVFSI
jgi:hypothetical protein